MQKKVLDVLKRKHKKIYLSSKQKGKMRTSSLKTVFIGCLSITYKYKNDYIFLREKIQIKIKME